MCQQMDFVTNTKGTIIFIQFCALMTCFLVTLLIAQILLIQSLNSRVILEENMRESVLPQ
jgi:hypothetical protein